MTAAIFLRPIAVSQILLVSKVFVVFAGDATVSIKFHQFINGGGRDWKGRGCEFGFSHSCDHVFTLCFDRPSAPLDKMFPCTLGWHMTDQFTNTKTIQFDEHTLSNGLSNPLLVRVSEFTEEGIQIKIDVKDDDRGHSRPDKVDEINIAWSGRAWPWYATLPRADDHVYAGSRTSTTPTTLVLKIFAQCDKGFYGSYCETLCERREDWDEQSQVCRATGEEPKSNSVISNKTSPLSPITGATSSKEKGTHSLVIGLILGIFLAFVIIIVAVALVYRHRRNIKNQDRESSNAVSFANGTYGEDFGPSASIVTAGSSGTQENLYDNTPAQRQQQLQPSNCVKLDPNLDAARFNLHFDSNSNVYAEPDLLGATGRVIYDNPRALGKPPPYDAPPDYVCKEEGSDDDTVYDAPQIPVKVRQ